MQPDTHFIRFNMEILYLKRFIEKSLFPLLSGSHVILQHINSSQACSISRANLFNIITRLSEVHPTVCTGIIETRLLSQEKKKKKKRKSQNRDGEYHNKIKSHTCWVGDPQKRTIIPKKLHHCCEDSEPHFRLPSIRIQQRDWESPGNLASKI